MYEFFANLTLIAHLIFILFVVVGGLIFLIFPKIHIKEINNQSSKISKKIKKDIQVVTKKNFSKV